MEEIYKKNAGIVYYFLLARCRDEHLAQDLMQETFLRAYQSLDRYNGSCKMSVWLCQIAKHLWYQYLEKHKHEVLQNAEAEMLPSPENIEENLLAKYDLKEVLKELHKLPSEMREVMYLRMTGDLSFRDIGEILGRSENWARVTYFRGKEKIMKGMVKDE